MSIVLAGEFLTFSAFYEALCWLIMDQSQKDRLIFQSMCLSVLCLGVLPQMQRRFPISSRVKVPERKSSLEFVLILLDSLLENLFCSATKRCSGFGAVGSSFKTPLLIAAVKMFKELKMFNVANVFVCSRTDIIFFLKRLYLFPFEDTVLLSSLSNSQWINTKWCCTHF